MKDGEVVERGAHQQLLALKGEYTKLVSAQVPDEKGGQQPVF